MKIWNPKTLLLSFAIAFMTMIPLIASADEIHFPDPNLEAAMREALNKPEGAISTEELAGLTELDAPGRGISDLNGIEHCTNLQALHLWGGNQVSNVTPLSNLANLQILNLDENQISDISPLSGLINLKTLYLGGNRRISDIGPLSGLANLQLLDSRHNYIGDISPLANLTDLQGLWLDNNQIMDISSLANMTDLRVLILDHNQVTDISPLAGLTMIGDLGKEGELRYDLEYEVEHEKREGVKVHLGLSNNRISDVSPVVNNSGIGDGDGIDLRGNPLNYEAYDSHIPALKERGVNLLFDIRRKTIYVAATGNDATGDGTAENPYRTVQKGIDEASDSDTVLVADGTYTGFGNVNLDFNGKAIAVRSENGPANCIIDGGGSARGFRFLSGEGSDSIVDGFTIQKTWGNVGAGIYCRASSPTIRNNIITQNTANSEGGGILCDNGSTPRIVNNVITGNLADYGGAIFCAMDSIPTIINNTITENSANHGGAIACRGNSAPVVINTVLWGNDAPEQIYFHILGAPNAVTISYSDVQGGQNGITTNGNGIVNWLEGTIDADPLFVDAANDNYYLSNLSPCIGAGTSADAPATDMEGNPRPDPAGSDPDMGAYESNRSRPYATFLIVDSLEDMDNGSQYTEGDSTNTMRKCIRIANETPGSNTIDFSVSGTVSPTSALPQITDDGTLIDASSRWIGEWPSGRPGITLDGSGAGSGVNGLVINGASNCHIRGLFITSFSYAGENVEAGGITILGGARFNTIGGTGKGYRNVISGNTWCGVCIHTPGTDNNRVAGNYIGTDVSGAAALGNITGIWVLGDVQQNIIGGTTIAERNIISGNNGDGVVIQGVATIDNTFIGNYIGTDVNGTTALGNGRGIGIFWGAKRNRIERNVISGNRGKGVGIEDTGTDGNVIVGNYIGTDAKGTDALGNAGGGVTIFDGARGNIIGGAEAMERNIISGNGHNGILIGVRKTKFITSSNMVIGNFIGTDVSGTAAIGNSSDGVRIEEEAQSNIVGGTTAEEKNIISGNGSYGVAIEDSGTDNNRVSGNYIGMDFKGTAALGNSKGGVYIARGVQQNIIGGMTSMEGNTIAGNSADRGGGIHCGSSSSTIVNNIITGNRASLGGGIYCDSSSPTITNNIITGNSAESGGGIYCSNDSSPAIANTTITGNEAGLGGGIYCFHNSSPAIINTILWNNSPQEIYFRADGSPNAVTISYSNVQGGQAGIATSDNGAVNWLEGNISADPLFVDAVNGNHHLSDLSPCIGAGTIAGAPTMDVEGNPRPEPAGSDPDMGAYENSRGAPLMTPVAYVNGPYTGNEGLAVTFDGTGSYDPDGVIQHYEWDLDSDGTFEASGQTFAKTWSDDYTGTVTLRVTDNDGLTGTGTTTLAVNNVAPVVDAGADQTANLGDTVNVSSTFTDPGTPDTHTATIDWGDGIVEAGTVDEGTDTVTGSYVYTDSGIYTVTVRVTDDDGGIGTDTITVELKQGRIGGTVTDIETGMPIADANVVVNGDTAKTDREGKYQLSLRPGSYSVTVSADKYVRQERGAIIGPDETAILNFQLKLMDGVLSGIITDADTDEAVSCAVVEVVARHSVPLRTEADSQGRFRLSLRPGTYDVTASAKGYLIHDKQVEVSPDVTIDLSLSALPAVEVWPGDTDNDGQVSILDICPIGRCWDKRGDKRVPQDTTWKAGLTPIRNWDPKEAAYADADGNGVVNEEDVLVIDRNWGKVRPGVMPVFESVAPMKLLADKDMLDRYQKMYGALCKQPAGGRLCTGNSEGAMTLKDLLERLIAELNPRESILLANYPNPFNPDTWIPFVLAADGEVVIRIYSVNGRLVRELALGWLESGYYVRKDRAAYWDGRNELDERVASGVYMYQLAVNGTRFMRKMLMMR